MALRLYNTLTRTEEEFVTLEPGKVSMYVCGPTVYSDAHVGHAMAAIVFDMVRRYLIYRGYDVRYATNFTDVDDKIIRRANQTGQDAIDLANHYAEEYLRHLSDLNVLPADIYPRVSGEMSEIIQFIQEPDYGKLSNRSLDEAMSGTRIGEDARKENVADFALWKAAKAGEPSWDSPWGPGRPGWHIECSAMCLHHLGETIDIHGGGNDLVFPHHENEIAQSESLTGKPLARYWMHNGMLQLAGEKMSKSLGNLITIDDFLLKRSPDVLRMLIFAGHYRKPVVFNEETLSGAERSLQRIRSGLRPAAGNKSTGPEADTLREATESARERFMEAMDDDFNTANALAVIFDLVRAINTARDAGVAGPFYEASQRTLRELAGVLGLILGGSPAEMQSSNVAAKPFIELLIRVRADLRAAKQWALADQVRNSLKELGVTLEDGPEGTTWRYQEPL
jgi:cysteinyl-tRNA synthetase